MSLVILVLDEDAKRLREDSRACSLALVSRFPSVLPGEGSDLTIANVPMDRLRRCPSSLCLVRDLGEVRLASIAASLTCEDGNSRNGANKLTELMI